MRALTQKLVTLLVAFCLCLTITGAAKAAPKDRSTSATEVQAALKGAPGLAQAAKNAKSNGQSVILDVDGEQTAHIPLDPKRGINLGKGKGAVKVKLPNGNSAGKGHVVEKGTVAFPSKNGSANAVRLTDDGAQLLTVVEDEQAPSAFAYDFKLPAGATIGLSMEEQGKKEPVVNGKSGAVVLDKNGDALGLIGAPWATDANGKPVETWYTVEGSTLTQHINHSAEGVAYPVVADPYYRWYWNGVVITLTPSDMLAVAAGGVSTLSWMLAVPGWGWGSYAAVVGAAGWATWAYHNRQCFWFWVSPAPWDPPNMGTYRCR